MKDEERSEDNVVKRFIVIFLAALILCTSITTAKIVFAEEGLVETSIEYQGTYEAGIEENEEAENSALSVEEGTDKCSDDNNANELVSSKQDEETHNAIEHEIPLSEEKNGQNASEIDGDISTTQSVLPTDGTACAVLTDDGDLIFLRSFDTYSSLPDEKQNIKDIYNNSYSGYVFSGYETSFSSPALWDSKKENIKRVYAADNQIIKPYDMAEWFDHCGSLQSVDFTGFDTSSVSSMGMLFRGCYSLKTLNLNEIDTSNVNCMSLMFKDCGLEMADFSDLDTSKVTQFDEMFRNSSFTELDLRSFDTSKAEHMEEMFRSCYYLQKLDISSFDTNLANMNLMFDGCDLLTSVELGPKMTAWRGYNLPYGLPNGTWINRKLNIKKSEIELFNEYPYLASEWAGTWEKYIPVSLIELDRYSLIIGNSDNTSKLVATVYPDNAFDKSVMWSSSDSEVAIVDENGIVTPINPGRTIITVTSIDDSSIKTQCEVTVEEVTPLSGTAYAILVDNNTLLFFRSYDVYESGTETTVTDIYGNKYTGTVYADIETQQFERGKSPWEEYDESIVSVKVAPDQVIKPLYTSYWFDNCINLSSFIETGFDTSEVTDMEAMFSMCESLTELDIDGFDTSNVVSMKWMFENCKLLKELDLSHFNTEKVTNMWSMFGHCRSLEKLDLSCFNTSLVTNMGYMFNDCVSMRELDISSFDTGRVIPFDENDFFTRGMKQMFDRCESLATVKLGPKFTQWIDNSFLTEGTWTNVDANISISETELYEGYPSHASEWSGTWERDISRSGRSIAVLNEDGDLVFLRSFIDPDIYNSDNFGVGEQGTIKDVYGTEFIGLIFKVPENDWTPNKWKSNTNVRTVSVARDQIISPVSMSGWFSGCSGLISFNSEGFDTSNVSDMSYLFFGCSKLADADLSHFDTANVTDMWNMFRECSSLTSLDLSSFNTSNVDNFSGMFDRCTALTSLDLSSFDTGNATYMFRMFADCSSLSELDLSEFDTSKVISMREMFSFMNSTPLFFKSLDLSTFDTSNLKDIGYMFYGFSSLEYLDLSSFDTSKVYYDTRMELPAKDRMYGMTDTFNGCANLNTIILGTGWTNWINEAYLPVGYWSNGTVKLTEKDLYQQYPGQAEELVGAWKRLKQSSYGDIFPEDWPSSPEQVPTGLWISLLKNLPYTGKAVTQKFRVYDYMSLLKEGTDYTVKYANNVNVGTATVTITGKGNYAGTLTKTFDILPLPLNEGNTIVVLSKDSFVYNGKLQRPTVTVTYHGAALKNKTDYTLEYTDPMLENVYHEGSVKIVFKGNYEGSIVKTYRIFQKDTMIPMSSLKVSGLKTGFLYTGETIVQDESSLKVTYGKTALVKGRDYTVKYQNNTEAGTAYIIFEGTQNFTNDDVFAGTLVKSFKINPIALTTKNTVISGIDASYSYTGSSIIPEPVLSYNGTVLVKDKDYTVTYKNNLKAGTAAVALKGINNYKGSFNKTFKITKLNIDHDMFTFEGSYPYEKGGIKPLPSSELVYNTDYTVSYKNNTKLGTATITVKGKGNYAGTRTYDVNITSKDISAVNIQIPDKVYTGKANTWKSAPVLTDSNGKKLAAGTDYEKVISYTHNGVELEKNDILQKGDIVTVAITGKGNYEGTLFSTYRIVQADISKATVTIPVQYYTGRPITLLKSQIKVTLNKKVLTPDDFDIISYENNTLKGTAKVTIRGKGNYGGYKTVSFKINQRSLGITIRFDTNGATSGTMNDLVIYKDTKLPKCNLKKIIDERTYTFKGWSETANGELKYRTGDLYDYSIFKAGQTVTLYAVWE